MSNFQENFCNNLKRKNIRVANLAHKLKSNKSTLWNWTIGVRPASIDTLRKIAEFFEIDFYYFLFGECDPFSQKENADLQDLISGKYELIIHKKNENNSDTDNNERSTLYDLSIRQ